MDANNPEQQSGRRPGPVPPKSKTNNLGVNFDRTAIAGVRQVVVVASGKGGVGKSTVSTNLAVALAKRGLRVGLLDADIYGPSAPLMLGSDAQPEITAANKVMPLGAHGIKFMSFGLLADAQTPVIWRGPMVSKAIVQFCHDVVWGDLDYLVIDLPPGTGDVQLTLIEKLPIHQAIVVTTPQDVALIDARKALLMFRNLDVPVLGVVENMAIYRCSHCGHEEHIFGQGGAQSFAAEYDVPLLAHLPLHPRIRQLCDAGTPLALLDDDSLSQPFQDLAKIVADRSPRHSADL